jgi:anti-anti-sigma factor
MALKTETISGVLGVIEIHGTLMAAHEIEELRTAITKFVNGHYKNLVIDLSNLTYVSSSALGVFSAAHTSYAKRGWRLRFCGASNGIAAVFAVSRLNRVLSLYGSREEALAGLNL